MTLTLDRPGMGIEAELEAAPTDHLSNRSLPRLLAIAAAASLSAGVIQPGIRPRYRDGVFVIGNAAGEAHPVVAEGISMAMQSAWLLVDRLKSHRDALDDVKVRHQLARSYSTAWRRAFAPRIYAATAIAHWASCPRLVQATGPLLDSFPGLVTWGARLSGKSHFVVGDDSRARAMEWCGA